MASRLSLSTSSSGMSVIGEPCPADPGPVQTRPYRALPGHSHPGPAKSRAEPSESAFPHRLELQSASEVARTVEPVAAVLAINCDVPAGGAVPDRVGAVRPRVGSCLVADRFGCVDLLLPPVIQSGFVRLHTPGMLELHLQFADTPTQLPNLFPEPA